MIVAFYQVTTNLAINSKTWLLSFNLAVGDL